MVPHVAAPCGPSGPDPAGNGEFFRSGGSASGRTAERLGLTGGVGVLVGDEEGLAARAPAGAVVEPLGEAGGQGTAGGQRGRAVVVVVLQRPEGGLDPPGVPR